MATAFALPWALCGPFFCAARYIKSLSLHACRSHVPANVLSALPSHVCHTHRVPLMVCRWSPAPECEKTIAINTSYLWSTPIKSGSLKVVVDGSGVWLTRRPCRWLQVLHYFICLHVLDCCRTVHTPHPFNMDPVMLDCVAERRAVVFDMCIVYCRRSHDRCVACAQVVALANHLLSLCRQGLRMPAG